MKNRSNIFYSRIVSYVAVAVLLIAISGWIKIPLPIPITFQFATIALLCFLLGEYCTVAVSVYIVMGLIGLPVFAEGGGFSYVLNPTFGYLLGFLVGSFVCGKICTFGDVSTRLKPKRMITAVGIFFVFVYLTGTVYGICIFNFYVEANADFWYLMTVFVFNTLWKDVILCFVIIPLAKKLVPLIGLKK